jgi:hypothetical protein
MVKPAGTWAVACPIARSAASDVNSWVPSRSTVAPVGPVTTAAAVSPSTSAVTASALVPAGSTLVTSKGARSRDETN